MPGRQPPLVLSWQEPPVRVIRPTGPLRTCGPDLDPPPWLATGPAGQPFDFAGHMRRLVADIARRSPPLAHVNVEQLLFGVTQARSQRSCGLQARVTPLRFRDGQLTRVRHGVTYHVQRFQVAGREYLYLLTFCLPRFLDRGFDDKLITLFHELYHIGPRCDGDLRRHAGRCSIHSRSKKLYDAHMAQLARDYLAGHPDPALAAFLRLDFAQLIRRHGSVLGLAFPRPKLVPVRKTPPCASGHITASDCGGS